jgi:hypothetical protein
VSRAPASLIASLLLAAPADAALKTYTLSGDQSMLFPTCGTIPNPGAVSGAAVIDETGDGSPVLVDLEVAIDWVMLLGYVDIGIPGTTVTLDSHDELRPAPFQVGTGDTTTSISWGALTGWTHSGRLVCLTNFPGDPGPQRPPDPSSCVLFVGFEGTGAPAPLSTTELVSDPWSFSADGFQFDAQSVEFVNLGGGAVRMNAVWRGALQPAIPALPWAGIAVLGAALLYLGARALRRRSSSAPEL